MIDDLRALEFRPLTLQDAESIATWRYGGAHAMYDVPSEARDVTISEMVDPANGFLGAFRGEDLVGFCSVGSDGRVPGFDYDDSAADIGAGVRPDLIGRGGGVAFLTQAVHVLSSRSGDRDLRATIASWNLRALGAAKRVGFGEVATFVNSARVAFTVLVRRRDNADAP